MLRSGFVIDETPAPETTPDLVGEMKKQEMKQAIVNGSAIVPRRFPRRPRSGQKNAHPTGSRWTRSADAAARPR